MTPEYLTRVARRVSPDRMERLLSASDVRISQVSLLNTDLAIYSVRRRLLGSYSIDELAPGLADHAQFCSTATGFFSRATGRGDSGRQVQRYVGLSRARVSDQSLLPSRFPDYLLWLQQIGRELSNERIAVAQVFGRYALFVNPPSSAIAEHILLEVNELEDQFSERHDTSAGEPQSALESLAADVDAEGRFTVELYGEDCQATVRFEPSRRQFLVESPGLDRVLAHRRADVGRRLSATTFLNQHQLFRVVTTDGLICSHGNFYKSRNPLWGARSDGRIDLLQILKARPVLGSVHSEKGLGTSSGGATWERGSLFEYIDRQDDTGLLRSEDFALDALICDDLGNELADFIAVSFTQARIAMIHAKYKKPGIELSASAFHDVTGQAVKNLGVLTPQWDRPPKNVSVWNRPWRASLNDRPVKVDYRIRHNRTGLAAHPLWDRIVKLIRDPNSTREVWMVMGNALSYDSFDKARQSARPRGSVIQLLYILQSTWSAVSSVGAKLKVFCKA